MYIKLDYDHIFAQKEYYNRIPFCKLDQIFLGVSAKNELKILFMKGLYTILFFPHDLLKEKTKKRILLSHTAVFFPGP